MMKPLTRLTALLLTLLLLSGCMPSSPVSERSPEPDAAAAGSLPELTLLTPEPENAPSGDEPQMSSGIPAPTESPAPVPAFEPTAPPVSIDEHGSYTRRDDVALYLHIYGHLPDNFISKTKARKLGWSGGSLEPYAPGKCIGGGEYLNLEGLLPEAPGRVYHECDIDTLGKQSRGAKRIVWSSDGLIYYTDDHYESFTLLYGEE